MLPWSVAGYPVWTGAERSTLKSDWGDADAATNQASHQCRSHRGCIASDRAGESPKHFLVH
jgi:hypothetical protein